MENNINIDKYNKMLEKEEKHKAAVKKWMSNNRTKMNEYYKNYYHGKTKLKEKEMTDEEYEEKRAKNKEACKKYYDKKKAKEANKISNNII